MAFTDRKKQVSKGNLLKKSWISKKPSEKQGIRNQEWREVCLEKRQAQIQERGYVYCEICNLSERAHEMYQVWGHHKDRNRRNNVMENCELDHWVCHSEKYHSLRSKGNG